MHMFRRILVGGMAAVLLATVVGVGVGGWYLSDVLKRDTLTPDHKPAVLDMQVLAVSEGQVTLGVTPATSKMGTWKYDGDWGLRWEGGYGQVGAISHLTERQVVREFTPLTGQLHVGDSARLEGAAFPGDPQQAFGIPFQDVHYTSPVGKLSAWYIEGKSSTWAIFVHGQNSTPREGLRLLPSTVKMGYPALLINYRNDEGAPANPDGFLAMARRSGRTWKGPLATPSSTALRTWCWWVSAWVGLS